MPIIALQRRLREVGRIRLGDSTPATSRSGKPIRRPRKLTTFRLTSRDQQIIEAVAAAYGGTCEQWDAPDGPQWQVFTDRQEMPAVVPPGDMAFSQWMELWSGERCQRRCDGETEYLHDQPCVCDPANRECKTTSRLNVMLPEVPGFGLWRLETHGYYGAVELAGVVDLCRRASEAGHMLPARLRLEQRQVKRFDRDGKPITHNFVVPVLDLDIQMSTLGALSGGSSVPVAALASEAPPELPSPNGWKPVPAALPEAPAASVAEQMVAAAEPKQTKPRKNAAAPLKRTGVMPKTRDGEGWSADRARADEAKAEVLTPEVVESSALPADRALAKRAGELGLSDHQRHGLYWAVSGSQTGSGKDLTVEQVAEVFALFDRWEADEVAVEESSPGEWTVYVGGEESWFGVDSAAADAAASGGGEAPLPADEDAWRAYLKEHGVRQGSAIKFARETAGELGVELPGSLAELADASEGLRHRVAVFARTGE